MRYHMTDISWLRANTLTTSCPHNGRNLWKAWLQQSTTTRQQRIRNQSTEVLQNDEVREKWHFCTSIKIISVPTTAILCFSNLTDTQTSPFVSLHTQGIRGSWKQLLCILQQAQNNKDQTLKYFYAWILKKKMLMGVSYLTELNVNPIKWAKVYLMILRLQWQVSRFYFILQINLNQQADSQLAATASAAAGRRASKSLTSSRYGSAISTREHLTHEDFHIFSVINLPSDFSEKKLF